MSENNPRQKSIKFLKTFVATVADCHERGISEAETVQRSAPFLKEYGEAMLAQARHKDPTKLSFQHSTRLTAADFLNNINSDPCSSCREIEDKDVASLVNQLEGKSGAPKKTASMEVDNEEENRIVAKPKENVQKPLCIINPWKLDDKKKNALLQLPPAPPRNNVQHQQQQRQQQQSSARASSQPSTRNDPFSHFKTGRQEFEWQKIQQNKQRFSGLSKNVPAFQDQNQDDSNPLRKKFKSPLVQAQSTSASSSSAEMQDPLLKGFEKNILERIEREIVSNVQAVTWEDIVGLDNAKRVINESIIMPMNHPEFFTGLRAAPRAILFFGPPGNGKTMIGKCIASQVNATFMSISASSLTSKWIGESESLIRAMFAYAKLKQPTVIFFDEVDSLLEKRSSDSGGGNESYTRIKTEFLVQLDGVCATKSDRVLFIAATNLPHKIDEAMVRRFGKRIFVPLPVQMARAVLFKNLLAKERHLLDEEQFVKLGELSEGYSGSDIANVCTEAALKPLRKITNMLPSMSVDDIPPISFKHCVKAMKTIKPSVPAETIKVLEEWNTKYGFSANVSESDSSSDDD